MQGPEAVLEAIVAQVSHPDLFSVGRPGKLNSLCVSLPLHGIQMKLDFWFLVFRCSPY